MKILFAGIIARYPFGGVTWCSLMYLLGLRALGHEVFYIEDTGECVYDPVQNTRADRSVLRHDLHPRRARAVRPRRPLVVRQLRRQLSRPQRRRRPALLRRRRSVHQPSGGSWFWRDEYARIPRKVFIDSDPAFTQLAIAKAEPWYVEFFQRFDHLFTFGSNIGTPASPVPTGDFTWHKTWQPVTLDDWRTDAAPRDRFTTVMTWQIESFTDVGGNKDQEFVKFIDLPSRTRAAVRAGDQRPAAAAARARLGRRSTRWACRARSSDYREFIQRSKAEFGVAKHTYVATRSGWFSDRTECYLASGPPGAGAGHRLDRAPAARRGAARLLDAGRGARRHRPHQQRLRRATRGGRPRSPASTSTPRVVLPPLLRDGMQPLRIAHVAPVATTIPPPKSGSVETMTSLLTEGLVARGHDVTLFATGRLEDDARRCTRSTRTATGTTSTCGRGSCTRC